MHNFLKIATQMFPAERIENINRNAVIGGEAGIEVKLFGIPEVFQYTGQYASLAWDTLDGLTLATAPPAPTPSITVTFNGMLTPSDAVTIKGEEFRFVSLNGELVNVNNIEWVDFASQISATEQGIEVRVATDAPDVTRKFIGQEASAVYDYLVLLASNQEAAAAN
jgi:hypothetical protein